MKELTTDQFNGLKSLAKNPLIEMISIDIHSNGLLRVTVISKPDVNFNDVDALLEEIFPGMEYRGTPGFYDTGDIMTEFYSIDYNGETLINLCMKKAPVGAEAEKEITHLDSSTELPKFESLGPCESI